MSVIMKPPKSVETNAIRAVRAATLLNDIADDREACKLLWDTLDEPARETLLSYFAEWDKEFCEVLNPKP